MNENKRDDQALFGKLILPRRSPYGLGLMSRRILELRGQQAFEMATYEVLCLDKIMMNANLLVDKLTDFYGQRQYVPFMRCARGLQASLEYVDGQNSK